jgi:hypothetical protein
MDPGGRSVTISGYAPDRFPRLPVIASALPRYYGESTFTIAPCP